MAVLVEAISVIIRAEAIVRNYPGGWGEFRKDCPNQTLCADGELVRVGFMTPQDTQAFVGNLARFGIVFQKDGRAVDLVVADQQRGFTAPCDWAEFGRVDWDGDARKQVAACRLKGSKSAEVVTPPSWKYDESLSAQFKFVETGQVPEFMDFISKEDGIDVFQDLETGKKLYVGRTSGNDESGKKPLPRGRAVRLPEDMNPVKLEACSAYARMMNTLDFKHLEPWLAEDLTYSSQWVFEDMHGKEAYSLYIQGKLDTIRKAGMRVWAEIAYTDAFGAGPCVVLAQGTEDNLKSTMLITLCGDKISEMSMCAVPSPHECRRTGDLPI